MIRGICMIFNFNYFYLYITSFDSSDWRILINSRIVFSFHVEPENDQTFVENWIDEFKNARFRCELPRDISISVPLPQMREIKIYTDGGRLTRPVCVVEDGNLRITKTDIQMLLSKKKSVDTLFLEEKLEMIDGAETEDTWIAMMISDTKTGKDYSHCEICPVAMLGTSAGLIPFAERNQSPRNVYQASMAKQAFGTPSIPPFGNLRPTDHVLEHTEHPLVDTVLQSIENMPFEWMCCGQNAIVFVSAYSHNVEDSLIFNQDSLESGFMSSFTDRTYVQTAQRSTQNNGTESEIFEKPTPEKTAQFKTEAHYDKIESDGLPVPGDIVTGDTVIIGFCNIIFLEKKTTNF